MIYMASPRFHTGDCIMPLRLKTRCRYPGCPQLVRGQRFCQEHQTFAARLDEARRGTAASRGYDTAWMKLAEVRRQVDYFLCQPCLRRDRLTAARTVDHIVPVHVRPDWRLVLENTQVICDACHQRKTAEDTRRYGSSTATRLTADQVKARSEAHAVRDPPRTGEPDNG